MADPMDTLLADLREALLDGDCDEAVAETRRLRDAGLGVEQIVAGAVESAMGMLDAKCTVHEFNLLEIMLTGRAATAVMSELYPPEDPPAPTRGVVVLGTLEGDVHDLGKNIVKMILASRGYRVVDCGRNCSAAALVDAAEREAALAIGVSGLLTTVMPQARGVREELEQRGLAGVLVLAGGAALKQSTAERLNVSFVAETAFDGARYLDEHTDGVR